MPELKKISPDTYEQQNNRSNNIYYQMAQEVRFTHENERRKQELAAKEAENTKTLIRGNVVNTQNMQKKRISNKMIGNEIQTRINNDQYVSDAEIKKRDMSYNAMDITDIMSEIEKQIQIANQKKQNGTIARRVEAGHHVAYDKNYVNNLVKCGLDMQTMKNYQAEHGVGISQ